MSPRTKKQQEINRPKKLEDAAKQEKNPLILHPLGKNETYEEKKKEVGEEKKEKFKLHAATYNKKIYILAMGSDF